VWMREGLAASASVAPALSTTFVAQAAIDDGLAGRLGLSRRLSAISSTRGVGKGDLPNNAALPAIEVDPETFLVTIDGELIRPAPASELPLTQRYSLF
jgi:urease subunit alpha